MADTKPKRNGASTSAAVVGESEVMDVGRNKGTCGYCKSGARTSISHGLSVNSLTVDHYQALLDRGWRRSGCYLYKPEMDKTCCPLYTIRLKTSDFVPTKEQVRVSKKMQRFLDGTLEVKKADNLQAGPSTSGEMCSSAHKNTASSSTMEDKTDQFMHSLSHQIDLLVQLCLKGGELPSNIEFPKASVRRVAAPKRKLQAEASEYLIYSSNFAFQISAAMRKTKKNTEPAVETSDLADHSPKKIAEILTCHSALVDSSGFTIRACNGHINFYTTTDQGKFAEESEGGELSRSSRVDNGKCSMEVCDGNKGRKRKFEIRLKKSSFDKEEYSLYRKYQLQVHNETPGQVTESSYRRFLVDSPLLYVSPTDGVDTPPCGFGSFHQQYVVDGKIIAVGVFDILPKCLSSKYLFWDPDFAFLSLGKFSALQEIQWVSENQLRCPSLQYYYLGYYIHSCKKMRYKAAYRPSELLCPLRYDWVPYDIAKPLLDAKKYVALSDFTDTQNGQSLPQSITDYNMEERDEFIPDASNDNFVNDDEMSDGEYEDSDSGSDSEAISKEDVDLSNVLIGVHEARYRYKDIRHAFDSGRRKLFESRLRRYSKVVGQELSEQMAYAIR